MKLPRWLGALRVVVLASGAAAALVTFGVVGILLHANLPVGRAVTSDFLTSFLSDYFHGSVKVGKLSRLGLRGLSVAEVTVYDGYGNRVLVLSRLRASASLREIARQLLWSEQEVSIVIHHVRLEHGDVQVSIDPKTGLPTIAHALTPVPTPDSDPPGREVRVWLPVIEIGSAFGRGQIAMSTPTLEADIANIRGSVLVTGEETAVDVGRSAVELRGLGGADAKGVGSFHLRDPGSVWGFFDGHFGEVQSSAFVRWDENRLEVRLDVPQADPEEVKAIWADYPLHKRLSLHAEAVGPLAELQTKFALEIEDASIAAEGPLSLSNDPGIELDAEGKSVDLQAFFPTFPPSSIDLKSKIAVWPSGQNLNVEFNAQSEPGNVGEHEVPAIDVRGTYDELGLVSRATLHEPGLPAKVSFEIDPAGGINLALDAKRFALDHPRLEPHFRAQGSAEAQLTARIEEQSLTGEFKAELRQFSALDIQLERARAEGKFAGSIDALDELEIQARLVGNHFKRERLSFSEVSLEAKGPISRPKLSASLSNPDGQRLRASGTVDTRGPAKLDNLEVALTNRETHVSVSAGSISSGAAGLKIDNLVLREGASELTGDIDVRPDGIELRARGRDVNLESLAKALGLRPGVIQGNVTLDADLISTRTVQEGVVDVQFKGLSLQGLALEKLTGEAHLALDDHRLLAQGEIQVEELGTLSTAVDLTLGGRLDDAEAWRRATGSSHFELYAVNLSYLNRFLQKEWGIDQLSGLGSARLRLSRDEASGPPSAFFDAQTHGLQVTLAPEAETTDPTLVQGIDLQLGGSLDGRSGQTSGSVRAVDAAGSLLSASGTARLDVGRLWEQPSAFGDVLKETALETVFVIPARKLEELPPLIRPPGVEGVVSGRLSLNGTSETLVLSGLLDIENLRGPNTALTAPVVLRSRFNYAVQTGAFGGSIEAERSAQRILWGSFSGNAPLQTPQESSQRPRFTGEATLSIDGFPLQLLQPLSRARMGGRLRGVVALSKRGEYPDINAQLTLTEGRMQEIDLGEGQLSARAVGTNLSARARFADRDGALEVAANTKVDFSKPDAAFGENPISIELQSKNYDAVLLLPFVEELFSDLSGSLDAEVKAELWKRPVDPTKNDARASEWSANFLGRARLKKGVVQPTAIGLQLRDTDVTLTAAREGGLNVIEIVDLEGKAGSDEPNFRGKGKLYFRGISLSHGWAGAGLDEVPFVVSGVRLADLTGQVSASFRQDPGQMTSRVEVPRLRVMLPRSTGRSLIDTSPNPSIVIVQPLGEPVDTGEPGLPWHVLVNLGNEVRVQNSAINIRLAGNPELVLADELHVDGKVLLPAGGRVTVAGKLFVIEQGFIQFDTGDHTDPHINIRAVWRTPGGVSITANLVGTAREPELTLESDPPLPGGEAEIFALLFGGGAGNTDSNAASPALGAGATFLSDVLENTALRGVELRAGVEKRGSSGQSTQLAEDEWRSYAASVPLSDNVWFEGSYKTQERAMANEVRAGFSGTIDWRFKQDWALRTEVGELGTAVDLLWQYQY